MPFAPFVASDRSVGTPQRPPRRVDSEVEGPHYRPHASAVGLGKDGRFREQFYRFGGPSEVPCLGPIPLGVPFALNLPDFSGLCTATSLSSAWVPDHLALQLPGCKGLNRVRLAHLEFLQVKHTMVRSLTF